MSVTAALMLLGMVASFSSCSNDETVAAPEVRATKVTVDLPQIIDHDMTLTSDKDYRLVTKTFVTKGATLTIQAGTTIKGAPSTDPVKATALIITRGSKIHAQGSASAPIVFTAENEKKGGWGGIVLLGKAKVNQGTDNEIEGIEQSSVPDGVDAKFGGTDDEDNSGVLSYVRVEFAGAKIHPDNELNAFTFGGVGRGTQVDHIEAYHGADDGAEFFGGCVNVRYYACIATDDDGFDADWGYTGQAQFGLIYIDPNESYSKDPNGFEVDNDGKASDKTPYTHPVISNFTVIGTEDGKASKTEMSDGKSLKSAGNFRRHSRFTLVNSILYGFPTGLLFTEQTQDILNQSEFAYSVISSTTAGNEIVGGTVSGKNIDKVNNANLTTVINDPWNINGVRPKGIAESGANFDGLNSWFTKTTYKGAIASGRAANWLTESWIIL